MKLETKTQDIKTLLNYKFIIGENKSNNPLKPFYIEYGGSNDEQEINDLLKQNKPLYEYIREESRVKPYIDFEITDEYKFKYFEKNDLQRFIKYKKAILKKLIFIFKTTLFKVGVNVSFNNILILDGSRLYTKNGEQFYKISFHLTINLNFLFNTQEQAKTLLQVFETTEKEQYGKNLLHKNIDPAVYGKTQRLRTIYSNKTKYDLETLKPVNIECEPIITNNPIEYFVTYHTDEEIIIINNTEYKETINKKNTKTLQTALQTKDPRFKTIYNDDIQKLFIKYGMKTATVPEVVNNTYYKILYNPRVDCCVYGDHTHTRPFNNNPIVYAYIFNGRVYAGCYGSKCKNKEKVFMGCILERSPLEDIKTSIQVCAPILGLEPQVKTAYDNFINNHELRALCVKSSYGTGKTYILNEYVNRYIKRIEDEEKRPGRVLVISTRQSYARAMCGQAMKDLKLNNYLDFTKEEKEELYKLNRLCVSMEGLCGLMLSRWKPYDIIIIDESESVCRHLYSPTIKNGAYATFERLKLLMSKSKKVFLLDADLSTPTINLIGQFKENQITKINNSYTQSNRTYTTTYDKENFINDIKTNIIFNQNVYIVCLSATEAINLHMTLKPFLDSFNKSIDVYHGEAGDNKKSELKEVNYNWTKYNIVITTSTTGAGIDYNIKNHFHKIYGYITAGCACPAEFLQILNRVRHPTDNNINILLDSKLRLPYNILEKDEEQEQFIYTVNNAKYILDEHNKHIINNEVYLTYEDEEGFINNHIEYEERDYNFTMLTYYYYLSSTLNNTGAIYTTILKLIIEQQGNNIIFDPYKVKQTKSLNHRINNIHNTKISEIDFNTVNDLYTKHEKTEQEKRILTKHKIKNELNITKSNIDNEETKALIETLYKTSKHNIIRNLKECYIKKQYIDDLKDTDKEYTDETQRTKDIRLNLYKRVLDVTKYDYTKDFIITTENMNNYIKDFTFTQQEQRVISRSKLGTYELIRSIFNKYGFDLKKVLDRKTINGKKETTGIKHYVLTPNEEMFNTFNLIVKNSEKYEDNIINLCSNFNKYVHLQERKHKNLFY